MFGAFRKDKNNIARKPKNIMAGRSFVSLDHKYGPYDIVDIDYNNKIIVYGPYTIILLLWSMSTNTL